MYKSPQNMKELYRTFTSSRIQGRVVHFQKMLKKSGVSRTQYAHIMELLLQMCLAHAHVHQSARNIVGEFSTHTNMVRRGAAAIAKNTGREAKTQEMMTPFILKSIEMYRNSLKFY